MCGGWCGGATRRQQHSRQTRAQHTTPKIPHHHHPNKQTKKNQKKTADFGPKTALKIADGLREQLKAGQIRTAPELRAAWEQYKEESKSE